MLIQESMTKSGPARHSMAVQPAQIAPSKNTGWAAEIGKTPEEVIKKMTDPELYEKCKTYGMNARTWMRKFATLLPEVFKRQLYKKRGYASIYEFAGKLAGLNNATTDKILRLSFRLENKPELKKQFYSGSQGWSKLEKVAWVATPRTDEFWAKKVEAMPKQALEIYVREVRNFTPGSKIFRQENVNSIGQAEVNATEPIQANQTEQESNLLQSLEREKRFASLSFPVSEELEIQLRQLKQKIEKSQRKILSWGEVMQELLKDYQKDGTGEMPGLKPQKQIVIQLCPECLRRQAQEKAQFGQVTRHIPAAVQNLVLARSNNQCAYPDCRRPPDIFHHTKRFALDKQHDPDYIVPLCKSHERLVHSGLVENEEALSNGISRGPILKSEPDKSDPKFKIDEKVNFFRRESG